MKWLLVSAVLLIAAVLISHVDSYPMALFDCYWTGCTIFQNSNPAMQCRDDRSPIDANKCEGGMMNVFCC
ncbi:hypothetical protein L596_025347 [Steinernema carpocapsae]|uniref:Uncharacterized protein n=1 Tax=Steinernema carpocapsae TaxID=34508 RepID=A0A4U5M7I4_STECR|nr:hypothetical protein L596_025347 [Steinernema carpocapsae]